LRELFGNDTEFVKERFLRQYAPECYELLPEYNTQRKVESVLQVQLETSVENKQRWQKIRDGLYSLVAEVIFLEMEQNGKKVYYPRHSLHQTLSYRNLDDHSRYLLWELYVEYFFRRNESLWREKALIKLPALKNSTNMLLCGEDLGMVPACVPGVMQELGLLSLEVQRMPKNPNLEFGRTEEYPYLSVATPSSHDTSTVRGWWEEDQEKTQLFYNKVLGMHGESPETCTTEIVSRIIGQHLFSPSMWAVFPIQDLLGMNEKLKLPDPHAERINEPGNPEHYWQYRMHLTLEQLLQEKEFTAEIREMINNSGRNKVY
jgi:4-alpha-glucanotransferase